MSDVRPVEVFYLPAKLSRLLDIKAKELGVGRSELVGDAITAYFKSSVKRQEPLAGEGNQVPVEPLPRPYWPALAGTLADGRRDADRGVGDTLEWREGEGSAPYIRTSHALGVPDGHNDKTGWLNARFPYREAPCR